jgi:CelD/BcsL family acetyltransferase involved in cellulose biosynthesis
LRRARRFLEQEGPVAFERADTASRGPLLDALILLHTARWQLRGEPGVLADERLHAFHHRTSRLMLERGRLRLLALRCGGAVAAVLYGFALHGRLFAYLVGFDPKLAHASPGALLVAHAQEEAVREGLGAFELLRGREPYKAVWRPREQQNARLVLRFGGGPGPP